MTALIHVCMPDAGDPFGQWCTWASGGWDMATRRRTLYIVPKRRISLEARRELRALGWHGNRWGWTCPALMPQPGETA